jgi:carbonic anhydrase
MAHSRRALLKSFLTGAAATAIAGSGIEILVPPMTQAQTMPNPQEVVNRLMEGNRRFAEHRLTSFNEDLAILKSDTEEKQEPFAAVLSCADSRVPVEIIFDQSIGHIFVIRVAGNIATPDTIASLEYGAAVLKIPLIMVLGHRNCGAVKATIGGKEVPGQISSLYPYIQPAVRNSEDVESATRQNARLQANLLRTASPILASQLKEKHLEIVAAYYDIVTGRVSLLDSERV